MKVPIKRLEKITINTKQKEGDHRNKTQNEISTKTIEMSDTIVSWLFENTNKYWKWKRGR